MSGICLGDYSIVLRIKPVLLFSICIYSDKPAHSGAKNALLRAEQLLKLRWTPVGSYPVVYLAGTIGAKPSKAFLKHTVRSSAPVIPQLVIAMKST